MEGTIGREVKRPKEAKHRKSFGSIPTFFQKYEGISEIFQEAINSANQPLLPSITIFADGNSLRVCFADRRLKRSMFRTGKTPGEALEAIDTAIITGRADWRPQKPWGRS